MSTVLPVPAVRATPAEIRDVAALIAAALHRLPLGAWLVPDQHARVRVLAAWARIWTEHALLWGRIERLDDHSAVALWISHDGIRVRPVDYQRQLTAACGEHLRRFQFLDSLLAVRRPSEPHEHLAILATHPDHQGTGRAATLLHHTQSEHGTLPIRSQAITTAGRQLLTGHGFVRRTPIALPGAGQIVPMWRPAHTPLRTPFWDSRPVPSITGKDTR